MGIAHQAIGDFGATLRVLLIGERNLFADKFRFAPKMQGEVGRTAIWAEQGEGINAVGAPADLTIKTAKKVLSDRERLGTVAGLDAHFHREEPTAGLRAIEILREIAKPVVDVGFS